MIDLDDGFVKLDKAEAGGFMGYPDILKKTVRVGGNNVGTVEKIGPLGFVTVSPGGAGLDYKSFERRFFPWSVELAWTDTVDSKIEDEIQNATSEELETLSYQLRVQRSTDGYGFQERDDSLRARLLAVVAQRRRRGY